MPRKGVAPPDPGHVFRRTMSTQQSRSLPRSRMSSGKGERATAVQPAVSESERAGAASPPRVAAPGRGAVTPSTRSQAALFFQNSSRATAE
eukprot:5303568-Lingulodinium_polyedra.AAC.1